MTAELFRKINKAFLDEGYMLVIERLGIYEGEVFQQLVAVGGLSGSGKSTVSQFLADRMPALHLNVDVLRKQMAGCPLNRNLLSVDQKGYTLQRHNEVHKTMMALAERMLRQGWPVIWDSPLLHEKIRREMFNLAKICQVPITGIFCYASPKVIAQRLEQTAPESRFASDVNLKVANKQFVKGTFLGWHQVNTDDLSKTALEKILTLV